MENLGTHVTCIWLYDCRFAGNKGRNHHKIEWNIIWRDGQQREKPCSNIQYGTIKWYTIMIIEVIFIGKRKKIRSGKLPQINKIYNKITNSQIITRWKFAKICSLQNDNFISFHLNLFFSNAKIRICRSLSFWIEWIREKEQSDQKIWKRTNAFY